MMALGCQHFVSRSVPQTGNFVANPVQRPFKIGVVFQEEFVHGQGFGFDGPDGREPGVGYHRKISRQCFG